MKFKGFHYDGVFVFLIAVCAAAFTAMTAFYFGDKKTAVIEGIIFGAVLLFGFIRLFSAKYRYRRMLSYTAKKLDYTDSKVLSNMPVPVCVCDKDGFIKWANDLFRADIKSDITQMSDIKEIFGTDFDIDFNNYALANDKYFLVDSVKYHKDGAYYTVYKFFDNTELKETESKYLKGIPHVIIAQTDNIDDNPYLSRDTEKAELSGKVLGMIYDWADKFNTVVKKISEDRLMMVTEKSNIDEMIADKFSVLDSVRNCIYKEKNMQVTLSIGVSSGETIKDAEKSARKALDTAISRGGDQVAVLQQDGNYSFFGAVSKSADKKNKIKIKLWARQLTDEIEKADRVFITGHRGADYDCLGAAFGAAYICSVLGKPARIILNESLSLAQNTADIIRSSELGDIILSEQDALDWVTPKSLFILTDTHVPSICDGSEVFKACKKTVIIDHHRLVPGTEIEKYLFIHNPNASSACEIVTELIQQMNKGDRIYESVANALLAGIMLDTKEFVLRTSTVTFEAAAYLKSCGADTLKVSKFFCSDSETSKKINKVIYDSATYKDIYSISSVEENVDKIRLVASKAADEMLRVSGIKASFVLYEENSRACVSARSMGEVNVQLIMEALGGGGHQTMAACQIKDADIKKLKELLISELDKIPVKEN
ncbi:MAG: DHH family phosphoesterase [Clostridia bacterium]|nr:DHH family phosphoesterase [Clostridia bacterium]